MKDNRDILLASDASMAQGWIVEGGDIDEEISPDSTIDVNYNEGEFVGLPFVGPKRAVRELVKMISSLKLKYKMILYLMNLMERYGQILDDFSLLTILHKFLDEKLNYYFCLFWRLNIVMLVMQLYYLLISYLFK